jgi:hypothetical protein
MGGNATVREQLPWNTLIQRQHRSTISSVPLNHSPEYTRVMGAAFIIELPRQQFSPPRTVTHSLKGAGIGVVIHHRPLAKLRPEGLRRSKPSPPEIVNGTLPRRRRIIVRGNGSPHLLAWLYAM